MPTIEESQQFLSSLKTFYIIVMQRPPSFAQFNWKGEQYLGVWSSQKKARNFIKTQNLFVSGPRVVSCDGTVLKKFGEKVGVTKMALDYISRDSEAPIVWFYLRSVGAH